MLKIGLIKEEKTPPDTRVPFTPRKSKEIVDKYPLIQIVAQPSASRCFSDADYTANNISLQNDLSDCNVLFGVKEVKVSSILPGKTYFFFSHTKKKQPYNQALMQALIRNKVRMIDYECLTYEDGSRILGFGFHAGVVGAHNAFLTYGKKWNLYDLPAAHHCKDYEDMVSHYKSIRLPAIKIAITGRGRVTSGILDILKQFGVREVSNQDYLSRDYTEAVFTQLNGASLYERKSDNGYDREEFHQHPELYNCSFHRYLYCTDMLINGIYWDEKMPRLFEKEDIQDPAQFKISVIADITCDIDGSVPINCGASTIADPVYGISRDNGEQVEPFRNSNETIDVMAVDNLPNELPRDASAVFGNALEQHIIPELLKEHSDILYRATICENGRLTPHFEYLADYAYE